MKRLKDITLLLDIINSSLSMSAETVRYELFKKYMNQQDKLKAINQVLASINKKKLVCLDESNLEQNIELRIEENKYLKNENYKGIQTIKILRSEISNYETTTNKLKEQIINLKGKVQILKEEIKSLNGEVETLTQNLEESNKKLIDKEKNKISLISLLEEKESNNIKLYDELQNVKYRDVCSYFIDYFVCLLNEKEYDMVMKLTYSQSFNYVLNTIKSDKYEKYNNLLAKNRIIISDLFNILLNQN